jgi:hypothetical protein
VSEIINTDKISAIISTELVRNEVDDRATMSQKSTLAQVTLIVSRPPMPDKIKRILVAQNIVAIALCQGNRPAEC